LPFLHQQNAIVQILVSFLPTCFRPVPVQMVCCAVCFCVSYPKKMVS